jgi:hypothetical protein
VSGPLITARKVIQNRVRQTGRDGENVLHDSEETPIASSFQAPIDGADFVLTVNTFVDMKKCEKVKGKTTCVNVGSVYIDTLVFANIGF